MRMQTWRCAVRSKRKIRKWSTWGTEWVDWPFFSSKEELDFVLLLVQHAVAIVLLYMTIIGLAIYIAVN